MAGAILCGVLADCDLRGVLRAHSCSVVVKSCGGTVLRGGGSRGIPERRDGPLTASSNTSVVRSCTTWERNFECEYGGSGVWVRDRAVLDATEVSGWAGCGRHGDKVRVGWLGSGWGASSNGFRGWKVRRWSINWPPMMGIVERRPTT